MKKPYRDAFEGLLSGTITFDAFARATARLWVERAKYVMRHRSLPPAVSVDDVAQVMLLGAWQASRIYDASRTANGPTWACWYAVTRGTKWLDQQRQARWNMPSRHPIAYEPMVLETGGSADEDSTSRLAAHLISCDPGESIERVLDAQRVSELLASQLGDRQSRYAAAALRRSNFDLRLASSILYADGTIARTLPAAEQIVGQYADRLLANLAHN